MNSAIILAAGRGSRMKTSISKQYLNLKGKPILHHTLDVFFACLDIDEIILVISDRDEDICYNLVLKELIQTKTLKVVYGGDERQDSVYNGLYHVDANTDIVVIHDGARPFVTAEDITKTIKSAEKFGATALGVPIKETIKIVDERGFVERTPDRDGIWKIQTPQAFKYSLVRQAYGFANSKKIKGTDDSMLVEALGEPVKIIEGSYSNIKITTYEDLILAESIIEKKNSGQGE